MKSARLAAALLLLIATLSASTRPARVVAAPDVRRDPVLAPTPREHLHGHWVMGEDNHAYWCWGPTIMLNSFEGMPKVYATDCEGPHSMVSLHD